MSPSLLLWLAVAHAQGLDQHRPPVPAASVAGENGPGTLWVNPANLAFDPDARYGVFYTGRGLSGRQSFAATVGFQGLQVGLTMLSEPDPAARSLQRTDWSLDYATTIRLPERLSVGALISWKFVQDAPNYVATDAGASWRPLPWLGVGGVAQNLGAPDPGDRARPWSAAGLALRPLGDFAVIGVDYGRSFAVGPTAGTDGNDDQDRGRASLRLRPIPGLYLRGNVDLDVDAATGDLGPATFGGGLEVYFDGGGVGAYLATDETFPSSTVWIGTDEPRESLLQSGRRATRVTLHEAPPYQPRSSLLRFDPGPSWLELVERLRLAESDRSVRVVILDLRGPGLSWARWQELQDRVRALRERDKTVVAYLDGTAGSGAYTLATACDRIVLHPGGELGITGMAAELQHLRGLLDLVGVEPQFVRRSEYKSAPETYTRPEPSPAALEATNALLDDLYGHLVDAVATRTGGDADAAREAIDSAPWTARAALDAGLVDALAYPSELEEWIGEALGADPRIVDLVSQPLAHSAWDDPAKIAVVYVDGAIVDGESSSGGLLGGASTGADTVIRALDSAREDHLVRAVVLRVDSPGGSALASDRIWQALERIQEAHKPVVVSMGGVAASGGYYVAAGADAIFAEPATITGSIGVFGGKFSTAELFDTVGIGVTPVVRGRNSDLYSSARPWDDVQRAHVQDLVDETYTRFKTVVSDGRGLTMDEVEEIARGRVWTGQRALDIGLVDHLGTLQDAIADARDRAHISRKRQIGIVSYSPSGSVFEAIAPSLVGRALAPVVRRVTGAAPPHDATVEEIRTVLPDLPPALWVQAQHPDTLVWMMDPWLVDTTTR